MLYIEYFYIDASSYRFKISLPEAVCDTSDLAFISHFIQEFEINNSIVCDVINII